MRGYSKFLATLLALFLFAVSAFAQTETGQINGTLKDPSGAVVTNAKVTAISLGTKASRTATTDSNGHFNIPNLQPGLYDVTIEGAGFAAIKRSVQVTVGSRIVLDASMKVSSDSTVVEVIGSGGVQVNTERPELSQVISGVQLSELPTLNGNAYALVTLTPNISNNDPSGRGVGVAINGQRAAGTGITLDGADNVDLFSASLGQQVPQDAVAEFRVVSSNFGAEYGKASGGVVNVATKSGTNNFHGSLYEIYRSSTLAANTYDNNANGITKPRYVRNQFGYSIGGPVIKDKLFFFSSTEWIRVRSSSIQRVLVPTPQFIGASNAATQAFFTKYGALGTAINGPVLLKSDLTGAFTPVAGGAYAALPANTPIFGQVAFAVPVDAGGGDPQNQYQTTNKIDYNITDKTSLVSRYSIQNADLFAGSVFYSPYSGYNTGAAVYGGNFLIAATHIFSPKLISQSKFVYNRNRNDNPLGTQPLSPTLFFRNVVTRVTGASTGTLRVAGPGYGPFAPGSAIPFAGPQNLYQFNQDISWTVGRHQLRFGGQLIHTRDNREFAAFGNSAQTLSTSSLALAMDNFLNGQLAQFQGAVDPQGKFPCTRDANQVLVVNSACQVVTPLGPANSKRNNRFVDTAAYGQDSWKLTQRVTLNLGVRWEYYGVQHNADQSKDSNFYYGTGSDIYQQIRNGAAFTTPTSPAGGLWRPDYNNFGPRVGFKWDVFGNGKTSLGGGYGVSYERNIGNVTYNVLFNPPNFAAVSINSSDVGGNLPITVSNQGPLAGVAGVTKTLSNLQVRHVDENIRTAYAHSWNFSLERELAKNTVGSVSYSGSKGVDLYSLENPNKQGSGVIYGNDDPTISAAVLNGRLQRGYTAMNTRRNNGSSDYHALIGSVASNNLWNSGVTFQANYTWAHAIDTLSSTFSESGNNYNLGMLDPFNPGLDRGSADFDIRHRFVASAVWEVPYFKHSDNKFYDWVLSGWTFAPIINVQSGSPFTIYDCTNAGAISETCPRIIPKGAFGAGSSVRDDLGPNATTYLVLPATTTVINPVFGTSDFGLCGRGGGISGPCLFPAGMTSRNHFASPGYWNIDLSAAKKVRINEGFAMQFRGEFLNALNHSNAYINGSSAEVGSDISTSRRNNRNIQLSVRLIF